jgi:uncharacterized protein (TIGR03435 family)
LQSLLAERFGLVIRKTSKEATVYALVPAKGGPKLQPSPEGDAGPPRTMRSPGRIEGQRGTMHMLAAVLSNWLGRPVVDRTGLTGTYDYKLEYAQEPGAAGRGAPVEPPGETNPASLSGPSVFTALQEQLGLKLESQKGALESIVIERAHRPTAN